VAPSAGDNEAKRSGDVAFLALIENGTRRGRSNLTYIRQIRSFSADGGTTSAPEAAPACRSTNSVSCTRSSTYKAEEKLGFAVNFSWQFEFSTDGESQYVGPRPSVTRAGIVAEPAGRCLPDDSCLCGRQVAHSDQVIGRQCENEYPIDAGDPAMVGFTQSAYSLNRAEDLFYPFALALTDRVPRMASGALVNDTGLLAREMRGDPMFTHFLNQFFVVVAFVGTQGDPMPARNLSTIASAASGSARPVACVTQQITAGPWRLSISTWAA
jgi:hypothetical protein